MTTRHDDPGTSGVTEWVFSAPVPIVTFQGMTATKKVPATTPRDEVADGNGIARDAMPRFKRHVHPETGEGTHTKWADCASSSCTWAAMSERDQRLSAKATRVKARATKADKPAPAPKAKAKAKAKPAPRPNAERRNEATHEDGAFAVAFGGCKSCKARKGAKCFAKSGERTNFVHALRMKAAGK